MKIKMKSSRRTRKSNGDQFENEDEKMKAIKKDLIFSALY